MKNECPLQGKCLTKNLIYQATIVPTQNPENTETYVGLCEPTFKERISNHKKDFKHQKYEVGKF